MTAADLANAFAALAEHQSGEPIMSANRIAHIAARVIDGEPWRSEVDWQNLVASHEALRAALSDLRERFGLLDAKLIETYAALSRAEAKEGLTKRAMVRLMGEIVQAADDVLNDPAKQDFRRLSDLRASCLSRTD